MLPQFVQSLQVLRSLHQVGRGIIWQMIDDDPQAGHLVGNPHHLGQQRGASNDVNLQPGFCQKLQVCDELRLRQFGCEAPPPQVPDADTEKERILVEASEIASKTGLAWFEVSNRSDENRVLRRKVENPLVVFDERTRLHLDDAGDSERLRESDKLVGEDSPVQLRLILGRPGYAARASRIVEMRVRINDRSGRSRAAGLSDGGARSRQKRSPLHGSMQPRYPNPAPGARRVACKCPRARE